MEVVSRRLRPGDGRFAASLTISPAKSSPCRGGRSSSTAYAVLTPEVTSDYQWYRDEVISGWIVWNLASLVGWMQFNGSLYIFFLSQNVFMLYIFS